MVNFEVPRKWYYKENHRLGNYSWYWTIWMDTWLYSRTNAIIASITYNLSPHEI